MTRSFDPAGARSTPPVASLPDRACANAEPEIFFPEHPSRARDAIKICNRCPHEAPCLQWALETHQVHGVWGGTSGEERERMIKSRRAA